MCVCEVDGSSIFNQQQRLARGTGQFKAQLSWNQASISPLVVLVNVIWSVPTDPSSDTEVQKGIKS